MNALHIAADELPALAQQHTLELDAEMPVAPLAFVHLNGPLSDAETAAATAAAERLELVLIGVAADHSDLTNEIVGALDFTLSPRTDVSQMVVAVPDVARAMDALEAAVHRSPRAAVTLVRVLRVTSSLPRADALAVESMAYSMLLAGGEFSRWRASRTPRVQSEAAGDAVLVHRDGTALDVTINRPEKHNAFDRAVRDGLIEAFDVAVADESIERVNLAGVGRSFCSGGDLDEFGSSGDVTTAHLVRLDRSVALRILRARSETHAVLHGACIGAGIEIPSFAAHVAARHDAFFRLPEVAMGLIPGAGGTVGIPERIGRWRTAYLALSGARLDVDTAHDWGLVDECID